MTAGTGKLAVASVGGVCLLLLAAACGGDGGKTVTGLVVEAVERNLVEIELLKVRDRSGKTWEFTTERRNERRPPEATSSPRSRRGCGL